MNKMSFSFGRLMHYAVLIMLAVIFLFPVVWVALSSFKYQQEIFQVPMTFLPKNGRSITMCFRSLRTTFL